MASLYHLDVMGAVRRLDPANALQFGFCAADNFERLAGDWAAIAEGCVLAPEAQR